MSCSIPFFVGVLPQVIKGNGGGRVSGILLTVADAIVCVHTSVMFVLHCLVTLTTTPSHTYAHT